jgi:hypothetical protein
MKNKGIISVAESHIEKGIAKYHGVIDAQLTSPIKSAGSQYTPYLFKDGRILLVLPGGLGGFLYDDREAVLVNYVIIFYNRPHPNNP